MIVRDEIVISRFMLYVSYNIIHLKSPVLYSILNNKNFIGVERIKLYCKDKNVEFYKKLGFEKVPISKHSAFLVIASPTR